MLIPRSSCRIAASCSDIYVLDGYDEDYEWISSFEVYSKGKKQWKSLTPFSDERSHYSVCSFLKGVYVVGGIIENSGYTNSCCKYETKDNKCYQIANLQTERSNTACTVFEGKVVVTGGLNVEELRSVESYDYYGNEWKFLSNMITANSNHSAISMGIKMFVIGVGNLARSEVYDNISRTFTEFNFKQLTSQFSSYCFKALGVSNKLMVFADVDACYDLELHVYNIDEEKWISEDNLLKNIFTLPAYPSIEKHPKINNN